MLRPKALALRSRRMPDRAWRRITKTVVVFTPPAVVMRREQVAQWADKIAASTPERDGVMLFATQTDRRPDFVKDLAYSLRQRSPRLAFVVGSLFEGKPTLTVMLGEEIVAQGVNAGAVVRDAAKLMQGGGGGQPFFATAGGKNADGLQATIDRAVELIKSQVNS